VSILRKAEAGVTEHELAERVKELAAKRQIGWMPHEITEALAKARRYS
jgi:hypothetical protein